MNEENESNLTRLDARQLELLRKGVVSLGEMLDNDRLERRNDMSEMDELHIELEAVKRVFSRSMKGFDEAFAQACKEAREDFDPRFRKCA